MENNSNFWWLHTPYSNSIEEIIDLPYYTMYKTINRLYPNEKKLEMYSQQERKGRDAFGNEVIPLNGIK